MIDARAAVLLRAGSTPELTDVQIREPRGAEVLVGINAVGICHTDISTAARWPEKRLPMVFGHEGAGTVLATGPDARIDVGGQVVAGTIDRLLILQDEARPWPVRAMAELKPEHFAEIVAAGRGEVEFVLLGAGAANALPPRPVREALQRVGIGLEFMDTPSACRTYNILTAEGRKLAAALIAV